MPFSVEYSARAVRDLKKIDRYIRTLIISWIEKNLVNCDNPRKLGKALAADRTGQWRYRIGHYRVLAEIDDRKVLIMVVNIGHRKDIYKTQKRPSRK